MVTQDWNRTGKQAIEAAREAITRPQDMVQEYPLSSMLVVFSLGLGVGIAVSQLLLTSNHEPTMTERMGRQLYDSMCNLSNAVTRTFHS
jgi:hypothetical protein